MFRIREFGIVCCKECGLVYTRPRLAAAPLVSQYDNDYYESADSLVRGYDNYVGEKVNTQKTFAQRWARITAMTSEEQGRVLDLGCAHGFMLELAQDAGWEAMGLDVSQTAVDFARGELGLMAEQADLNDLELSKAWSGMFDVVILWDVLEHVTSPLALLTSCFDLLKPDGIVSVITPNREALYARLMGAKWVEYQKLEEHVIFFSSRLVCSLLMENGFEISWCGTAGKHVSIDFALGRLAAYAKGPFELLRWAMRHLGMGQSVVYVDPRDKMHVIARKDKGGLTC